MGKTYRKNSSGDDYASNAGKNRNHANGKKTGGMRTLNSYVEEDDFEDGDMFKDDVEISDSIQIRHTKHIK